MKTDIYTTARRRALTALAALCLAVTPLMAETVDYGFSVGDVHYTSDNIEALNDNPYLVTGSMTYDAATATLTLDHAYISSFINFECMEGNIALRGRSTVDYGVQLYNPSPDTAAEEASFAIYGTTAADHLVIDTDVRFMVALYLKYNVRLTISNCTVEASSNKFGISGAMGLGGECLDIVNANVYATGTTKASLKNLVITLTDSELTEPADAVWDDYTNSLCDASGNVVNTTVKYEATNLESGITDITATADASAAAVYTLDGRRVAEPVRGINIVRRADGSATKVLVR
ncbi:MAG: hypothetical protein ACI30W_05415 [Muribaculaceae bacterium]